MRFDVIDLLHRRLRRLDLLLARVGAVIDAVPESGKAIAIHRRSALRNTRGDIVRSIGLVARGMRMDGQTVH